jgi:hypothetical protein
MKKYIFALLLLSSTLAHKTIDEENGDVETLEVLEEPAGTIITDADEVTSEEAFDIKVPRDGTKKQGWKERVIEFFSHEPSWYWTHYKEEIGYLSFIVVIAINFYFGKNKNNALAGHWRRTNLTSIVK